MPPEQQTIPSQQPVISLPQSQPLSIKYGGFWMRYLALNLDSLITAIIITLPLNIIAVVVGAAAGFRMALVLLQVVLIYTYFIYLTNKNQATIGKKLLGLRVVSEDGTRLPFGKIAFRETIGKFISMIILFVGYLMVAFTSKKQGLHDKMVGSVVLYNRAERKTWAFVVSIIFATILPAIAILGILASVALVTLNVARERTIDALVKTSLVEIQAKAEADYNMNGKSYESVLSDSVIMNSLKTVATNVNTAPSGNLTSSAYAIYFPLKKPIPPATGWCIDSTGASRESVNPGTSTVCP